MATCGLVDKCGKTTGECRKLSHPFMNAKKSCYEATENQTPLGQTELALLSGKPLSGRWRYSEGYLFCGGVRVCAISLDTNPSSEFTDELGNWMAERLAT